MGVRVWVQEIPREGLEIHVREATSAFELTDEVSKIEGPIALDGRLQRVGATVLFDGVVSARMCFQCSRCAREFSRETEAAFHVGYEPLSAAPPSAPERELTEAELDIHYYTGGFIELGDLVREQVILAAPIQPLCRPDCQGLCPLCRHDLNEGPCRCRPVQQDEE